MGMTIDEAISHLYTYSSTMGSGQTTQEQHEDAKRVAIDTMRKYQKIQEIYQWAKDRSYLVEADDIMDKLKEVIEDGKVGCEDCEVTKSQEPTTKNDLGVDYRSLEDIKKLVERKADALDGVMLDAGGVIIGLYFAIANDLPSVTPQESTTKNDLGVDCVARQDVERFIEGFINEYTPEEELEFINLELNGLKHLPSVTPQEPQTFKWCETCKEYDQEKHCCHRWSKVIRDTVDEMKQEPILDKIKAEIEFEVDHRTNMLCAEDVFAIIDKYKAESEG